MTARQPASTPAHPSVDGTLAPVGETETTDGLRQGDKLVLAITSAWSQRGAGAGGGGEGR